MTTARAVMIAAAVLALGSCQVLAVVFGSVFPSTVGLAKLQADLSGQISQSEGSAYSLRVVQSGARGYVILVGSGASGSTAYIYDLDLSLKTTLNGLTGNGVMVDPGGQIIVGSQSLNPSTLAGTAAFYTLSSGNGTGTDGFYDGTNVPSANFGITGGNTLSFWTFSWPWVAGGNTNHIVTLSSSLSNIRVDAILDDGTPSGNVTLAVSQAVNNGGNNNSATCYFITAAKSAYSAGGSAVLNKADSSPQLPNIDTQNIGFAQGSIIAYDSSAEQFLKLDPSTGSTQSSFYVGADLSSTRLAYPVSGGAFYGWDTKTRVLTKYAAWW